MSAPTLGNHLGHVIALGAPAVLLLGAAVADRVRHNRRRTPARSVTRGPALLVLAVSTAAAGGVHAFVAPEHFREYALFGWFFVATSVAQFVAWVMLLRRPRRWLVQGLLVGNAAVVVLWAQTRFVGLPLGPDAGSREGIGVLDLIATSAEIVAFLAASYLLLPQRGHVRALRRAMPTQLSVNP